MHKKNIGMCALLVVVSYMHADVPAELGYQANSGYPAQQGYQANSHDSHHHHHKPHHGGGHRHSNDNDSISDQADKKRLAVLDKEDDEGYFYTNLSKAGLAAGTVITVGGIACKSWEAGVAGVLVFGASGISGYVIGPREDARAHERNKEREKILERRAKRSHHHHD
jgi:hypothetical protein